MLTGAGDSGGTGGTVGVLPGVWVDEAGLTAATAPGAGQPALTTGGAPVVLDWLAPGTETVLDVSGSVAGDGTLTFVVAGASEATTAIASRESGTPPLLVVTVMDPVEA